MFCEISNKKECQAQGTKWINWYSHILLVGIQKCYSHFGQLLKLHIYLLCDIQRFHFQVFTKEQQTICPHKDLYMNVSDNVMCILNRYTSKGRQ